MLPFSIEYQRALVTLFFRSPSLLTRVRPMLAANLFADPSHALIAKVALAHQDRYRVPPTGAEVLEGLRVSGAEEPGFVVAAARALVENAASEDAPNEPAVEAKVREWAREAAFRVALLKANVEQHIADADYGGLVDQLRTACAYAEPTLVFTEYADGLEGRLDKYAKGSFKDRPVPTFSRTLNEWLRGGTGRGELTVYLALQGVGKTQCLLNDAVAAAEVGEEVWVHSCEVSKASMLMRLDQRLARRTAADLRMEDGALLRALPAGNRIRITHSGADELTVDAFRAELDRMKPERRPGLFIADYGQLLRSREKQEERRIAVASVYRDLRNMAEEFRMAVESACQSNRTGHETLRRGQGSEDTPKILTFSHIAEAFDVGAIVDNAISINQGPMEEDLSPPRGRAAIIKAREGVKGGVVNIIMDHAKSLVKEEA